MKTHKVQKESENEEDQKEEGFGSNFE